MAGHYRNVCMHGHVKEQCRCPHPEKITRVVPCATSTTQPHIDCQGNDGLPGVDMSLPPDATILMTTGVFHEKYGDDVERTAGG